MFTTKDKTPLLVDKVLNQVHDVVVSTMGPNGNFVAIKNGTAIKVTKDGVTVARSLKFETTEEEMINKIITEPAVKTDNECGDGTTTTIFLTKKLTDLLRKYPSFKERKAIKDFFELTIENLQENSIVIDKDNPLLIKLATTTANHETSIAKTVTGIYKEETNGYPVIELVEGVDLEDKVMDSKGLVVRTKFSDPGYSARGNGSATEFFHYRVLMIDDNLRGISKEDSLKLLDLLKRGAGDLIIIGRNVEHDFNRSVFEINSYSKANGGCNFIRVLSTNVGGSLGGLVAGDIASIFGCRVYRSLDLVDVEDGSGIAVINGDIKITVDSKRTIITEHDEKAQERINLRVKEIKEELDGYTGGQRQSPQAKFNETRIRNLNSKLITIFVGGETISDIKERLDRYEDVVRACKSALEHGVLPGQGNALIAAKPAYGDFKARNGDGDNLFDIYTDCEAVLYSQKRFLLEEIEIEDKDQVLVDSELVFDLVEGVLSSVEESVVYDTSLASIVALKGGLSTALILSNLSSLLMGDKFAAITTV